MYICMCIMCILCASLSHIYTHMVLTHCARIIYMLGFKSSLYGPHHTMLDRSTSVVYVKILLFICIMIIIRNSKYTLFINSNDRTQNTYWPTLNERCDALYVFFIALVFLCVAAKEMRACIPRSITRQRRFKRIMMPD